MIQNIRLRFLSETIKLSDSSCLGGSFEFIECGNPERLVEFLCRFRPHPLYGGNGLNIDR